MKRNIYLSGCSILLVIILLSCNMFSSRKISDDALSGRWKIDSVNLGRDSGNNNTGNILLAMAVADSQDIQLEFKKDTVYTLQDGYITDQTSFKFISGRKELIITDSTMERYIFNRVNDSSVSLRDKDSTTLFLKKLPLENKIR